jgi:hypothetical protein
VEPWKYRHEHRQATRTDREYREGERVRE